MPLLLDFDEKAGRWAAAMGSGQIWVMGATIFPDYGKPGYKLPKGLASESPETAKDLPDPNPEPFRWPLTMPLPASWSFEQPPDKLREVAPGWSDDVDKYFPYKNQTEYYCSTPWFIQKVSHIQYDVAIKDPTAFPQAPPHRNKRVGPRPSCSRHMNYIISAGVGAITK
ncbi:carbohydrate-binding module family 13 protein [Tulasnella calospora MUT 4182]|uniref:Carbohydrate-binding module family 13 protein n=1 Tax=Tulasnella calospora MUT 4182 TaxID=1051891 RepID=A0A0C3LHH1_9AGAM|nr:carbohydrate-binding module family 13 protein [Tulasnella calospora MUT 4182]